MVDLGDTKDVPTPLRSKILSFFHAVLGEKWSNSRLAPPPLRGWRPPENPGSTTANPRALTREKSQTDS